MSEEITEFYRELDASLKVKVKCLYGLKHLGNYNDDAIELTVQQAINHQNPQVQHKALRAMLILVGEGYYNTS